MSAEPKRIKPEDMSQEQLVAIMTKLLLDNRDKHPPGSYERAAYDGSIGMLATAPHQPWWKRAFGRLIKKRAEKKMKQLRKTREEAKADQE